MAIPYTVVVLSPNGTALYANQTILDYTGLTKEEAMAPDVRTRRSLRSLNIPMTI